MEKEEEKKKKQDARRQQKEEEDRLQKQQEEETRQQQQKDQQEQRIKREAEKKEREAAKRLRKKVLKQVEGVLQDCDYFSCQNYTKFQGLIDFDRICQSSTTQQLTDLCLFFEQNTQITDRRNKFFSLIGNVISEDAKSQVSDKTTTDQNSNLQSNASSKKWSVDDCFLLTKAAKIFPPGTQDRWEVITAYFNQHSGSGIIRKTRDVMAKSKELQDPSKTLVSYDPILMSDNLCSCSRFRTAGCVEQQSIQWLSKRT